MASNEVRFLRSLFAVAWVSILPALVSAQIPRPARPADLKLLPLEELMRIDVTTANRRPEPIGTTAAAVSVITGDDLRRSGVTTIADALLLADGVHVARGSSTSPWSIGMRGFNGTTPNKELVMIDGRTINSSIFTGVFWNTLDYVLEDIDRIEVIRGPGAALWGANAVNGVINIITKHSRQTQGAFALVSAGNEDPALVTARYGGGATGPATWRVYGKFGARSDQILASGASAQDARQRGQAGFRVDGGTDEHSTWMLKGDAFHSSDDFLNRPNGEYTELALQGRWSHALSTVSRIDLQSYYRREYRRVPMQLTHHVDVFDVDAQHSTLWGGRHAVVFGGDFRQSWDGSDGTPALSLDPADRSYLLTSAFAQDDIMLRPDRWYVTLGARYEHNAFSGSDFQPSVRTRVLLPRNQTIWGAVSHAVRRPTRVDVDLVSVDAAGTVTFQGDENFLPESLVATEAGYRVQPTTQFSADVNVFDHAFHDLRSMEAVPPSLMPSQFGNTLMAHSRGAELGVNIQAAPWWRAHLSYTLLDVSIEKQPGSNDVGGGATEANDPRHIFGARGALDLPHDVELDVQWRDIGELQPRSAPGYAELNFRLGWHPTHRTEVWVAGQDVLHSHHPELGNATAGRIEFQRSLRIGVALRLP